jgi:hypothetical protein
VALGAAAAAGLNEAQRRAASYPPHVPLVIFAPAGAGKTLTLVHRVLELVSSGGLASSQVLCLTFTRKASVEVRQRLHAMANMDAEVATFHGWCLRLLRTFAHVLGRPSDFRLASPSQQLGLLREGVAAWQALQGTSPPDSAPQTPRASAAASGPSGLMPSGLTARRASEATLALCRRLQRAMRDAKLLGAAASPQTNALLMSDVGAYGTRAPATTNAPPPRPPPLLSRARCASPASTQSLCCALTFVPLSPLARSGESLRAGVAPLRVGRPGRLAGDRCRAAQQANGARDPPPPLQARPRRAPFVRSAPPPISAAAAPVC